MRPRALPATQRQGRGCIVVGCAPDDQRFAPAAGHIRQLAVSTRVIVSW